MPRVPWEQRRDKLSGALWVIPVLFMAGAIAVGGLLSLINIGPDSAIAPLLFRGHADEAQKVLLAVAGTLVGVLAFVIGLTMIALQVAANRYSPRLMRNFLRDRPAQIVLGLVVAAIIYNGAGVYIVGQPAGTADTKYPRLAVTAFYAFAIPFVWIADETQRETGLSLHISGRERISPRSVDPRIKNYHWLDLTLGLFDAYEVGAETPSVKAPHWWAASLLLAMAASDAARNLMPRRLAMATTFSAPTISSSRTMYVLTDRPSPPHIVRTPFIQLGAAFCGQ